MRGVAIGSLAKQVAAVRAAVNEVASGQRRAGNRVLCFVDADLPRLGAMRVDDYLLLTSRRLAKRLNEPP